MVILHAFQAAALAASAIAAVTDARNGRIPNWLTLPVSGSALVAHAVARGAWGVTESAAGLVLCGGVPLVLFRASRGRAIGGGDVKLFGALGALLGPTMGLEIELGALALLLIVALARLAYSGQLLRVVGATARLLASPFSKGTNKVAAVALTEMRLGPAIALATVVSVASQYLARWVPWL
ncbi:MAG TPA: A24 family peptidase [Polyangiaceae bacterium]|nr:A24 family peptidase [Polyangiaceae bacterium]